MKYPQNYRRLGNSVTYCFDITMKYLTRIHLRDGQKGCILPFPKKGDLRIIKNYQDITLTSIVAKVYNTLLLNHIKPEIVKILRKNQNGFQRNQSATS